MKSLFYLFVIFFLVSKTSFSQDIIALKNGINIKAKVLLVKNDIVYYKDYKGFTDKVKLLDIDKVQNIYLEKHKQTLKELYAKRKDKDTSVIISNEYTGDEGQVIDTSIVRQEKTKPATRLKPVQKQKKYVFKKHKLHKKKIGLGMDVFFTGKDNRFAGTKLDFYLLDFINTGIGYGYFSGYKTIYFTQSYIFTRENKSFSPMINFVFMSLSSEKIKTIFNYDSKINKNGEFLISSIGAEYYDISGITAKFWIGISFIDVGISIKNIDWVFGFNVAKHF